MSDLTGEWALILGCSSGFGEATSRELARRGVNIMGVHFDSRSEMDRIDELVDDLESNGVEVKFYNKNAASDDTRETVLNDLSDRINHNKPVKVLLHSIAFGTLLPFISTDSDEETVDPKQMDMTLEVMAHTVVYWAQDMVKNGLLGEGSRIFAMTSAGGHKAWPGYGAVSAAKAALEAHIRQLTVELGEIGATANCIQAGVTDTPALRKIPGHERMLEHAQETNPTGRTTTPTDVAELIGLLAQDESRFVSGNVIRCDGGEDISR